MCLIKSLQAPQEYISLCQMKYWTNTYWRYAENKQGKVDDAKSYS